jgi:hypothetical protein
MVRLEDAIVTPTVLDPAGGSYTGCVHDRGGRVVPEARRTSTSGWRSADPEVISPPAEVERLGGTCLYLGHYTRAYGHFLLESLSRFWALGAGAQYDKVIFQPWWLDPEGSPLHPTQVARVCFECFGIGRDDIVVADRHLRVENLLVPSPLFRIGDGRGIDFAMHGDQGEVFREIVRHCTSGRRALGLLARRLAGRWRPPSKAYLSRMRLAGSRRAIENEAEIERVFRLHGFEVVYPEALPFERQVALYHGAGVIAGIAGSAMHNSVFMRPGATAITIWTAREHQKELRGEQVGRIQELCDEVAGVRHHVIKFAGTIIDPDLQAATFDVGHLGAELAKVLRS